MENFTVLTAIAAPILRENIDTDAVVRIERLWGAVPRDQLGAYCFETWRYRPDKTENPDFVLNQPPYRVAKILLTGANFGCGSSREGAVWALAGQGIRCVIAPSFGDIFRNNCFQNGLLPVAMDYARIEAIARQVEADPAANQVTVDLQANEVIAPDGTRTPFSIPQLRREALLEGLDEVELTQKREPEIAAFQKRDAARRPWIYQFR
jgi:3-isopropylmalate/(R)-2-methylmalate dehydratase small subunit